MMHKVTLPSAAWFGDRTVEIAFPSTWDVTVVGRKEVPALSTGEMRERLRRPFGTPPRPSWPAGGGGRRSSSTT